MAQRVAIALALAGQPRLLIADEPTTALDASVRAEVLGLLRRLQAERGMAILLVSHDWGVIRSMCQRAYVMYAGHMVEGAESTGYAVAWFGAMHDNARKSTADQISPVKLVRKDMPPVLTIHGDKDELVPYAQAQRLQA